MTLPIPQETAGISLLVYGDALTQGMNVLVGNFKTVAISFLLISISAYASVLFLRITDSKIRGTFGKNPTNLFDHISLGLSGSSIFLVLLSAPAVVWGKLSILLLAIFMLLIAYLARKNISIPGMKTDNIPGHVVLSIVPFVCIFVVLLFVKYSYIYKLELPLNIDSVNHAYYIDQIVSGNGLQALRYYHYGFHYICAFISSLTGENIPKTMLIFGQALQTVIPFVIYFPVHKMTNNSKVALFCVALAGLGFSMPSISASWGKYPALLAILSFCYVSYAILRVFERTRVSPIQLVFAICVILISILIHTRMPILLASVLLALSVDKIIVIDEKPKGIFMGVVLIVFLTSLLNESISETALWLAMQPYKETYILFGLLIVMVPFSAFYFGRYTFRTGLVIAFLFLFFLIPAPKFLTDIYYTTTLIDRPLLSMFLFIPICILFGTGLAGVEKWIAKHRSRRKSIVLIGFFFILFLFPNKKVMKPLPHSIMAGKNDYQLYEDIKNNLPTDAKILIPNFPGYYYDRGLDGGVWVEFMTGRQIHQMSNDTDLASCSVMNEICATGTEYIYVGNKPYSFSADVIDLRNSWYQPAFSYPDAKLYRIVGCFTCE
jgi:hypothetical protein